MFDSSFRQQLHYQPFQKDNIERLDLVLIFIPSVHFLGYQLPVLGGIVQVAFD